VDTAVLDYDVTETPTCMRKKINTFDFGKTVCDPFWAVSASVSV
jgi:hypothetical protein